MLSFLLKEEKLRDQHPVELAARQRSDQSYESLTNQFEHIEEAADVPEQVPEGVDCSAVNLALRGPLDHVDVETLSGHCFSLLQIVEAILCIIEP